MIWCDGVERWLNDGMPPRDAAAARAHARRCAACSQAIADAVALEAMLAAMGETARPAPAGFTDHVMARIDAEREAAAAVTATHAPASAASAARRGTTPWWLVVAAEPVAATALALVPALAAIVLFLPIARDFLVASCRLAISSSVTATLNGVAAASADATGLLSAMNPTARLLLAVGLVPLLLWSAFAAPTWLAGAMSRQRAWRPRSRS